MLNSFQYLFLLKLKQMAWALSSNHFPAVHSIPDESGDAIPIRAIRKIIFTFINFRLSLRKFKQT